MAIRERDGFGQAVLSPRRGLILKEEFAPKLRLCGEKRCERTILLHRSQVRRIWSSALEGVGVQRKLKPAFCACRVRRH